VSGHLRGGSRRDLFYKAGVSFFPSGPERREQVNLFVSNKGLSGKQPAPRYVNQQQPFREETFIGFDVLLRF
jgi:hypothetical protein